MDPSSTGPRSADGYSAEHDTTNADAFVRFWTDIRDVYIPSPNDASLEAIVVNGKELNTHLTFSHEDVPAMAANLAVLAGVADKPDPEPNSTT